jgi:glycine/D-amino acid oxidase-like deaminating enzyme
MGIPKAQWLTSSSLPAFRSAGHVTPRIFMLSTPSAPCEPSHIAIPTDVAGLRSCEWLDLAKAAMDGKSEEWRRWLELHQHELADLRSLRPNWADRVEAAAIAPDLPQEDAV